MVWEIYQEVSEYYQEFSDQLTEQPSWSSDVCSFFELVVLLNIFYSFPTVLCKSLYAISLKLVASHFGFAGVSAHEPSFPIVFEYVFAEKYLAVINKHDSIAFVGADVIVFDVDNWGDSDYSVEVATDGVFG